MKTAAVFDRHPPQFSTGAHSWIGRVFEQDKLVDPVVSQNPADIQLADMQRLATGLRLVMSAEIRQ